MFRIAKSSIVNLAPGRLNHMSSLSPRLDTHLIWDIVPGLFIRGDNDRYMYSFPCYMYEVDNTQSRILHRLRTIPLTFMSFSFQYTNTHTEVALVLHPRSITFPLFPM